MLDSLTLSPLPTLHGERVILRGRRDSDVDDRLRYPIDPEEEDGYGSSWRREWDGRRFHTREYLATFGSSPDPRTYTWMVEYDGHCIGSAGLEVNPGQHCAEYTVGLFVAALRGRGLGREVTRLVLAWAFGVLGVHRVELQVLRSISGALIRFRSVARRSRTCGSGRWRLRRRGIVRRYWHDTIRHRRTRGYPARG